MSAIEVREINGRWYVYEYIDGQCMSVGASNPEGGRWFANGRSDSAIKYVGRAYKNKRSAYSYAGSLRKRAKEMWEEDLDL